MISAADICSMETLLKILNEPIFWLSSIMIIISLVADRRPEKKQEENQNN